MTRKYSFHLDLNFQVSVVYEESCKIFIVDICSYGMLLAIDGKSKAMYLVYGDEVFCRSGPPEYMSATVLTHLIHGDSYKNNLMDKIQKNMMVPDKPKDAGKETLRYTHFSNILECEYIGGMGLE